MKSNYMIQGDSSTQYILESTVEPTMLLNHAFSGDTEAVGALTPSSAVHGILND